ncbi:hypothetical protein ACSBR1_012706 [Camellia fascicularis]
MNTVLVLLLKFKECMCFQGRIIIQLSIYGKRILLLRAENTKNRTLRQLRNQRGHTLQCSHYVASPFPEDSSLPCVVYCHGNSGCRADANEAAVILLPSNITIFTLEFSGSGLSDGDYAWNLRPCLKLDIFASGMDSEGGDLNSPTFHGMDSEGADSNSPTFRGK